MTKFKFGDRVTLSGIIQSIDDDYPHSYKVFLDGDDSYSRFNEATMNRSDTTFRDQAAIAVLQAWIAREGQIQLQHMTDDMKVLFDYAEALDAERKRRNGE